MIEKKLLNIIALVAIIGIIVFFYYNRSENKKSVSKKYEIKKTVEKPTRRRPRRSRSQRNKKKRVRFSDEIKYHYYDTNNQSNEKIDIDQILRQKKVPQSVLKDTPDVIHTPALVEDDINIVLPINLQEENGDDAWDSNFGQPLITKNESRRHFDKMQKSNRKYEQSMSEFTEYQVDKSALVEPEFKIDPFKPSTKSNGLKNQKIKDIYDMQVATVKAAPKKIKKVTSDLVSYENDSENNGGLIPGTNLHGFDCQSSMFGDASFGNQF